MCLAGLAHPLETGIAGVACSECMDGVQCMLGQWAMNAGILCCVMYVGMVCNIINYPHLSYNAAFECTRTSHECKFASNFTICK